MALAEYIYSRIIPERLTMAKQMSQKLMGSSVLMGNLFTPETAGEMANLKILLLDCFACLFVYLGKLKITETD